MRQHLAAVAALTLCIAPVAQAGLRDDVGYTALQAEYGAAAPNGAGIDTTQVEAVQPAWPYFLPSPTDAEFVGKVIVDATGGGSPSSHATWTGRYLYGLTTSIAPGISAIDAYEATRWTNGDFLLQQQVAAPRVETRRIQNHSWITDLGTTANNDALRRLDLVVQRDGVVVTVATDNVAGGAMPPFPSSAFNVITVGRSDGVSSVGPTATGLDGAGRVKPDLVVPINYTSRAAPTAAGAAALLLQTADARQILPTLGEPERRSAKALLAKALLLAGATKAEFPDWRKGFATPSTDGTVPLDYRYGAGELNVYNSYRILTAGDEQDPRPSDYVNLTGWDFGTVGPTSPQRYFLDISPAWRVERISIIVTWNRQIATSSAGGNKPLRLTPSLPNVDLRLYRASGFVAGALHDQSISTVDNVEHVYLTQLPAGQYAIEVAAGAAADYAIAWDVRRVPACSLDMDADSDVDLVDFGIFQACFNGPNRAPLEVQCQPADSDRDGDVDLVDFAQLQACFNGPNRVAKCL